MAASPRDRIVTLTPVMRMVAASLETVLDEHIQTRRDRKAQIDWNLGHCNEAIALHLETKYRQAGWTYSRAWQAEGDTWTLSLGQARLVLPEGITQDDE